MIGSIVDNRYRLLRPLSISGNACHVYLALDLAHRTQVALKVIRPSSQNYVEVATLKNEYAVLSRLDHPNIIKALDFGFCSEVGYYLSTEYVPGSTLGQVGSSLSEPDVRGVLCQMALAIDYLAFRGVFHHDISPDNILISSRQSASHLESKVDGSFFVAKLIDFGLAGVVQLAPILPRGTPPFIAPEVLSSKPADLRSEIYSLGASVLESIRPSLDASNNPTHLLMPQPVWPLRHFSDALNTTLMRMTASCPDERYSTGDQILSAVSSEGDPYCSHAEIRSYFSNLPLEGRISILDHALSALGEISSPPEANQAMRPRLYLFAGEEGVGKTRLLEEIRIHARLRDIRTVRVACNAQGLDDLDGLYQRTDSVPEPTSRPRLPEPTGPGSSKTSELAMFSIYEPGETGPAPYSNALSERLYALHTLAVRLESAARSRPLLLFFEDLQWADVETLELIRLLAAQQRGPTLFASYRTDTSESTHLNSFLQYYLSRPFTQHTLLDRLTELETANLLASVLGDPTAARELGVLFHRLTGGNPLLVQESLLSLVQSGQLSRSSGTWQLQVGHLDEILFPTNLRSFAHAQIAHLNPRQRRVLGAMAVFRVPVSHSYLSSILRRDLSSLGSDLNELAVSGVIVRSVTEGAELNSFRHPCVRDVVYEELAPAHRKEIHREIGSLIESSGDQSLETRIHDLAFHYLAAMDPIKGPEYAFLAASHAARRYAFQRAIDLLTKGLDLTPKDHVNQRLRALQTLGSLLVLVGELKRAQGFYFEMLLLARTSGASDMEAIAICELARCLVECGEIRRALAYARDADSRFGSLGHTVGQTTATLVQALAFIKLGQFDEAAWLSGQALHRAVESRDMASEGVARTLLALIAIERSDNTRAVALTEKALEIKYQMNDITGVATSLSNMGLAYLQQGFLAEAKVYFEKALEEARSKGLSLAVTLASINLGELQRLIGELQAAESLYNEALALAETANRKYFSGYAIYSLGACALLSGRMDESLRCLNAAEALHSDIGDRPSLAWLLICKTELHLALNDGESARTTSSKALELAAEISSFQAVAAARSVSVLTSLHYELLERVLPITDEELAQARKGGKTQSLARLLEARATLRLARQEPHLTLVDVSEMRSIAEETGLRPELARAALVEGQALLQLSRRAEARLALETGAVLAREMGLRPLLSHLLYWLSQAQEAAGDAAGAADSIFESADLINAMAGAIADDDLRRSYLEAPTSIAVLNRAERLVRAGTRPRGVSSLAPKDPGALADAAFHDVGRELGADASLRGLLTAVLDKAIEAVRADRGMLILLDPDAAEVTIARNLEGETLGDAADYCRSILQDVARGDPILAMDVPGDERFRSRKSVTLYHIQSLMCVPLKLGDRVLGALYFDSRTGRRLFREVDLELMQAFAGRVAGAISEAQQEQRLREGAVVQNRELAKRYHMDNLVGEAPVMERLFRLMKTVIRADCNVLVVGESGTGKELVARAVHFGGSRRLENFVPLDCGAIPESLIESELFGYRRGAFTGAECDKKGLFEEADGGTLFLDEITNTSPAFQVKLLRVLQSGEFRRLGETLTRRADVRIIAATNADVDAAIKGGRFREDLYYRLNVVTLTVPPLRERSDDIPLLAEHFARRHCASAGIRFEGIGRGALTRLQSHAWPGNVRELEHCIEAALVVSGDGMVRRECLPERVLGGELEQLRDLLREDRSKNGARLEPVIEERTLVEDALVRAGGDKSRAARLLGWSRMRLYRRMKALGISYDVGKQTA